MSTHAWQSYAFDLRRVSASFLTGLCLAAGLLALIAVSATSPGTVSTPEPALSFVENAGQENAAVRFAAHATGASFFFTQKEAVLAFERGDAGLALRLGFPGANPAPELEGQSTRAGTVNYLVGDASQWRTGIPTFGEVVYRDLWPGVDMVFRGAKGALKYEFLVAPGADPSRIGLAYRGADGLRLGSAGTLLIDTPFGTLRDEKPRTFQVVDGRRVPVESRFALGEKTGSYGFALGAYDSSLPLVIDPGLVYSTYLGGSDYEETNNVALGADGHAYVTGFTESPDFPTSAAGAYDQSRDGVTDAFVTRLDATGNLVYSTFIGGTESDASTTVAVDALGRAYVGGSTSSTDFPTTPGALRTTKGLSTDAFVTRLSANGASLSYSTYLGAYGASSVADLALDPSGGVVVVGNTSNAGFPTTTGAFDETKDGINDGFVAKLSADGSAFVYSSYLGGTECDLEQPTGVAVDSDGNAYVTGYTSSADFPSTPGAFDPIGEGCTDFSWDAYVTKLDPTGSALVYSTFLHGDGIDSGFGIAVDGDGSAYVVGATQSADFPTTPGAFDESLGGFTDGYVVQLNPAGSALEFSTYLGGTSSDNAVAVALREDGRIYVGGGTGAADFPTTPGAFDESANGSDDAYIASLDPTGSSLLYGTYLGGSAGDYGLWGIGVDDAGVVVYSGYTESSDLPTSAGAFDSTFGGGFLDGWVAKLETEEVPPSATDKIHAAIAMLEDLITPQNQDKLEDVIEKLESALDKLALSPPDRQGAAGELEGAVGDIAVATVRGPLSRADGRAVMTELAEAARILAEDAIDDAQGGDAGKLAEAEAALALGDSRLAAGRFKPAVAAYKDAISKADGA